MKHIADITAYLEILRKSEKFHVLVIVGAPGWAKTTTIREVLSGLGVNYRLLGAYATPLALFNTLHEVATSECEVLVCDDVASVFQNQHSLALLNAASWPSAASDGSRRVVWASTSDRAAGGGFDFTKKLVVLTNHMPQVPQAEAFINRAMRYEIVLNHDLVTELLHQAATSVKHFPDAKVATEVADFLSHHARLLEPGQISLRNLEMGYEFALLNPAGWRELLAKVIPKTGAQALSDPDRILWQLQRAGMKTEEQAALFSQMTGKSRRTFFNQRKRLGLTVSKPAACRTLKKGLA